MALRNGSRFAVSMADVFPHGCHLVPDSIAEAMDYDEKTKRPHPRDRQGDRTGGCSSAGWWTWTPTWKAGPARSWSRSWPTGCPPRRPAAVRAGRVRRAAGHPLRHRPGTDGVLAARDRDQGRPAGRQQGCGLMPATGDHGDRAGRWPVRGASGGLPGPDSAAVGPGGPAGAAGDLHPARPVDAGHVRFARDLAAQAAAYATEVERTWRGLPSLTTPPRPAAAG